VREQASRPDQARLSHLDATGRPRMVDVSAKPASARRAVAEAEVALSPETVDVIESGSASKGDVLSVAQLAGIMGAKKTPDLIPLCHPIPLTDVSVDLDVDRSASVVRIRASAATVAETGVEMEALTAASVAALTVYDMVKSIDRSAEIRHVRLLEKSGGRSGEWRRNNAHDNSP
jgi:cyclic pyranopterin phosphate synthase